MQTCKPEGNYAGQGVALTGLLSFGNSYPGLTPWATFFSPLRGSRGVRRELGFMRAERVRPAFSRPYGTRPHARFFPALKRWAIGSRSSGAGFGFALATGVEEGLCNDQRPRDQGPRDRRPKRDDQRPTISDQRSAINDQRSTTNDQRPTTKGQRLDLLLSNQCESCSLATSLGAPAEIL